MILSASVIITLSSNNLIEEARRARIENEIETGAPWETINVTVVSE